MLLWVWFDLVTLKKSAKDYVKSRGEGACEAPRTNAVFVDAVDHHRVFCDDDNHHAYVAAEDGGLPGIQSLV